MTRSTKTFVCIEILVPISGTWTPAEPDVGVMEGHFEDAQIDGGKLLDEAMRAAEIEYADTIQEALGEEAHDAEDPDDAYDRERDFRDDAPTLGESPQTYGSEQPFD